MSHAQVSQPARSWAVDGPPLILLALVFAALSAVAFAPGNPIEGAAILAVVLLLVLLAEFTTWLGTTARESRREALRTFDSLPERLKLADERLRRDKAPWW